jgi:hypothetical protein
VGEKRLPTIDELAALAESQANSELPGVRLRAAIELSRDLTGLGDALTERFVFAARTAGMSWTEIGQAFGTSKQAAQQRYGTPVGEPGRWPGRWTAAANAALDRAGEEARRLGHDYVGTEHVLLGLASAQRDSAADILRALGVAPDRILSTTCMRPGPTSQRPHGALAVMPRLKQALEHGRGIADGVEVRVAGTEHLLAGIVAVSDSMAVEILRRLGVSASDVVAALAERLDVEPQRLGGPRRRRRRLLAPGR